MSMVDSQNWYALFVESGQEDKVKERLAYKFGDTLKFFVPKRQLRERKSGVWHEVVRTLFQGYVLAQGYIDKETYYSLKGTPGLIKLLKSGDTPLIIEPYEIEIISRLICNGEVLGISNILVEDDKVTVVDGPLYSLEGQIVSIDRRKSRAKVNISFLGEPRIVEMGVEVLAKNDI